MKFKNIAIIGGGPAGCVVGALLARGGCKVGIFQKKHRPELIVGESLLPSVIHILRELGIEEEVKSYSKFKPGATFCLDGKEDLSFGFDLAKGSCDYAYNTPRDKFDKSLQKAALKSGCQLFTVNAKVILDNSNLPSLDADTMAATEGFFDNKVDLIIDASGRSRILPKLLNLSFKESGRKDKALFAHLEGVQIKDEGSIHVDRFNYGWGWRIPLCGKVSLGIVLSPEHLKKYGQNSQNQYDNFIAQEGLLVNSGSKKAKRLSPVMTYTNYQWRVEQMNGPNWLLVGDSAGFIDPVFSTGLHLAMLSAKRAAKAILSNKSDALDQYAQKHRGELATWKEIVNYWYDGRLFTLFRIGQSMKKNFLAKIFNRHMTKHVTRIFTGEANHQSYSSRLLKFMTTYGIRGRDPGELRIN